MSKVAPSDQERQDARDQNQLTPRILRMLRKVKTPAPSTLLRQLGGRGVPRGVSALLCCGPAVYPARDIVILKRTFGMAAIIIPLG